MIHDKRQQRITEARRPVTIPRLIGDPILGDAYELLEDAYIKRGDPFNDYQRSRMNRAWAMRLAPTEAESAMEAILAENSWWWWVQEPLGRWIVDFYCDQLGLVIEVDGGYHLNPRQRVYDRKRDDIMRECGFVVVRYWNDELDNQEAVADDVDAWCGYVDSLRAA